MNKEVIEKSELVKGLKNRVKKLDAARTDKDLATDIGFFESLKAEDEEAYGSSEKVFLAMGVEPNVDTISNLQTMPDTEVNWVVPEIIRTALSLGLRKSAIWPSLVAADQAVSQRKVTMPHINMSDATPKKTNEGATISLGSVSYGQKDVSIFKLTRGFKITDEVRQYVSLNLLSIFLRDFGVKLGIALDTMMIRVAINGDQPNGSNSAPVIGVGTANTLAYKDLLKLWVRGSRLGRDFSNMISGEEFAIDMLDMDEFKLRMQGTPQATLNIKTPVPTTANLMIHGIMPDDQLMAIDKSAGVIRLTSRPLLVESDRIISNQTEETYCSITTGFAKMFDDSVVLIDRSLTYAAQPFPDFMDISDIEVEEVTVA